MKITGRFSRKRYRCLECGHESFRETNHYGYVYPSCEICRLDNPLQLSSEHECLEPLPDGWGIPERWKVVKLGDVVDFL